MTDKQKTNVQFNHLQAKDEKIEDNILYFIIKFKNNKIQLEEISWHKRGRSSGSV